MRIVHTSKSPFEIWLFVALAASGVGTLISPRGNSPALAAAPLWAVYMWSSGLVVATVIGFVAALTNRLWSLYVERGAVLMLGVLLVAYVAGFVVRVGPTATAGAALLVGLAVASGFRARQITRDIRRIVRGESK